MIKGQQGGDFAPNGYQQTIDEEFGIGPTRGEFQPTEDGPNPFESKMYPQTQNLTNQYTNPQSRQRPRLGMSPDLDKVVDDGNFNINLPEVLPLKEQWNKVKAINIPNIFPDLQANTIHQYYYNQPDDWWDLILYPDPDFDYEQSRIDNPNYYHMYKTQNGDESIPRRLKHCHNLNNNGKFSYVYRRTGDMSVQQHPYLDLFKSDQFRNYLSEITGHENLEFDESHPFVSNYESGHYNGPHTDGDNGRIAFVFHLSKDWKPSYGGLFVRMDWDFKTINKAICPPFNTLSIFDVSNGAPHLVTEVAQGVDNKRISFTGWYQ
jgi:hypothetical protein